MSEGLLYETWIGECRVAACGHRKHYGDTQALAGQALFEHLMLYHDMTPKKARAAIALRPTGKQGGAS